MIMVFLCSSEGMKVTINIQCKKGNVIFIYKYKNVECRMFQLYSILSGLRVILLFN